jgi:hypothetical protein
MVDEMVLIICIIWYLIGVITCIIYDIKNNFRLTLLDLVSAFTMGGITGPIFFFDKIIIYRK